MTRLSKGLVLFGVLSVLASVVTGCGSKDESDPALNVKRQPGAGRPPGPVGAGPAANTAATPAKD